MFELTSLNEGKMLPENLDVL